MQKIGLAHGNENIVVGIDPGQRIGLSISYYDKEIESSYFSSVDNLIFHMIHVLGSLRAKRKIVKIGNGNMILAKKIINMLNLKFCSSFELEIVDEHKTSPKIKNFNQRGKRDMLSAKYISQREGNRHSILPLSLIG